MKLWHVPFHVIENEWTDDQFIAMLDRANERSEREQKEVDKHSSRSSRSSTTGSRRVERRTVSSEEFVAGA